MAAPNGVVTSKDYTQYSNGSSSSSSSHLDDVLESLPEIDDRCFMLPRVNSMQQQPQQQRHEEQKINLQNLQGGSFVDWSNPAILNSVSEFQDFQGQQQSQGMVMNYASGCNDLYVPTLSHVDSSVPEKMGKPTEEEVQSGFFHRGNSDFTQGFSNSVDPFGFRYPVQPVGYGFRQ